MCTLRHVAEDTRITDCSTWICSCAPILRVEDSISISTWSRLHTVDCCTSWSRTHAPCWHNFCRSSECSLLPFILAQEVKPTLTLVSAPGPDAATVFQGRLNECPIILSFLHLTLLPVSYLVLSVASEGLRAELRAQPWEAGGCWAPLKHVHRCLAETLKVSQSYLVLHRVNKHL